MKKLLTLFIFGLALSGCGDSDKAPPVAVDGSIRVAAFNVQVFGQSKRSKVDVMNILTRTAREFDVMLVQELRDASETTAQHYLDAINDMPGTDYAFVKSPRLGRTTSKEAYAFYYNTSAVECVSEYVWDDVFEREPYIASFKITRVTPRYCAALPTVIVTAGAYTHAGGFQTSFACRAT